MEYVYGDPHFYHKQIITYCKRPFTSVEKMNRTLINNYNQIVKKDDIVYILGDLMIENDPQRMQVIASKLNGQKCLILGNHDKIKVWDYVNAGFASVHTALRIRENVYLSHDPAVKVALPDEAILIHSHIHTLWKVIKDKKLINGGVDMWGFKPVLVDECLKLLEE